MIDSNTVISESDYMQIERLEEKPLKTLEERVARLEAVREISDLLWRYAHLSDREGMKERLVEEFCTPDVLKIHAGTLNQRFKGKKEVYASWYSQPLRTKGGMDSQRVPHPGALPPRGWAAAHLNFPMIIRIADDGAHAWVAYYHMLSTPRIENDELTLRGHTGTDSFWLVRTDRWRIWKWVVQTDIGYRRDMFPAQKAAKPAARKVARKPATTREKK